MIACRTASIVAFGALYSAGIVAACREEMPPTVPPLTTAHPTATAEPMPPGSSNESAEGASPVARTPSSTHDATVAFIEGSKKLEGPVCSRLFVVAGKGTVKAGPDTLSTGDVLVLMHPEPIDVQVAPNAVAISVVKEFECTATPKPAVVKTIIRAKEAPELRWAGGAARAHLDVGTKVSPDLYLGRLEAATSVPEHDHPTSSETIVAIEGSGTFTVDGKENHLSPHQIVHVPKKTKHAYKPDPGSKLVAIQIYEPPGPEQRFIAMAAAARDAGTEGGKP
jgi:mannose-6-phosphate isomerase-like protein (cupin superfamily)